MKLIGELNGFLRPMICISAGCISVAGSILNETTTIFMLFAFVVSFLSTAVIYSYNNMTDSKEDIRNGRKTSFFSRNKIGYFVIFIMLIMNIVVSGAIGIDATIFSLSFILTGFIYSYFRVKKYPMVKNIYTAVPLSLLFFLGSGGFEYNLLFYYLIILSILLIGSVLSDIRDYAGDKGSGVMTLPVAFGLSTAKLIVLASLFAISIAMLFDIRKLYILFVFSVITLFFSYQDKFEIAHKFGMLSFIIFDLFMLVF